MPLTTQLYSYGNKFPKSMSIGHIFHQGRTIYFSEDMTTEELAKYDIRVAPNRPEVNYETHHLGWDEEAFEWTVTPKTEEELQTLLDIKWQTLREERDILLKATDLTAIVMIEKTSAVSESLRTYRQALRDLPSIVTHPDDAIFPDIPDDVFLIGNEGT